MQLGRASRSSGNGLPGPAKTGPTIFNRGLTGRSHSTAQSSGATVSTSLLRSLCESTLYPNSLLRSAWQTVCERPRMQAAMQLSKPPQGCA